MEYQFEKNKLYDHLGNDLVAVLKKHKAYIAGGTITSLFCNRQFNDIDIYFKNEESCIAFVEEMWEDNDWVNFLTKKSVLVTCDGKDVQLIHFKFFDSAQQIFDTFDFTVCMGCFDFGTEQFVLHDDFLKHNSQRILKFNKDTSFPIVSLLRVQKYKEKGYTISKPEFLRIAIKCMDLNIQNVDDLKDQLGGMYGMNYDKIINFEDGEQFSLDKVIDKIENLSLDEDYFKKPEEIKFEDIDDIIDAISKKPVKFTRIQNQTYRITSNGNLKIIPIVPVYSEEIDGREYVETKKYYKFVDGRNDKLTSYWDKNFTYEIGKEAIPKNEFLYFNEKSEINRSGYMNSHGSTLLEVEIKYDDFVEKQGDKIHAKKCDVIRVVSKEEYEKWLEDECEEDIPF